MNSMKNIPKLSLLLSTIGKPTLKHILKSIEDQINKDDYLTIVVDGREFAEQTKDILGKFTFDSMCNFKLIINDINIGYWGHAIRNKYQTSLGGDFIMHCDDDDIYVDGAFDKIRNICDDKNKLYIFKMWLIGNNGEFRWHNKSVKVGNVGTPMGIIPNKPTLMGKWSLNRGGDGSFYEQTNKLMGVTNVEFVDEFIYNVRPENKQIKL